jgi:membrane protein implicated in regulation of membrane protease activity
MRKERTLLILGLWVAILPSLGFPNSWRTVLFVITGIALMYLAYLFYKQAKERMPKNEENLQTFTDNIQHKI